MALWPSGCDGSEGDGTPPAAISPGDRGCAPASLGTRSLGTPGETRLWLCFAQQVL